MGLADAPSVNLQAWLSGTSMTGTPSNSILGMTHSLSKGRRKRSAPATAYSNDLRPSGVRGVRGWRPPVKSATLLGT